MLLKRSIVLAAGVLLFIVAFVVYSEVSHKQMENRFRAEREKFHVDGLVLTASGPAIPRKTPASPSAATAPTSSPSVTPDTNTPVGPVPPPGTSAPDSAGAPSAPDTNSV